MDMIEDYLRAVSRLLPATKREDIIAELRDEILTRIEAKEESLGRTLTPDETEQLLRDIGHPIVVAARYRDEPQYAVGPALYPFWAFAVQLAIMIQAAISALIFIGRIAGGSDVGQAFGAAIGAGVTGIMTLIGFATVSAWLIERKAVKIDYFNTWRVRDLRFLDFTAWNWDSTRDWFNAGGYPARTPAQKAEDAKWRVRRAAASKAIGAIVGAVFVLLWWTGVIRFGFTTIDPASIPVLYFGALADVDWPALKAMLYWPVIAYLAAVIAFGAVTLAAPSAVRLQGLADIVLGAAKLSFAGWIWYASPLASIVSITSPAELSARIHEVIGLPINWPAIATFAVIFSALGALFRMLGGVWMILTGLRHDTSS